MEKNKKVLVGMSGGVDSSVAALLLLRQGHEVAGATFRLWDKEKENGDIRDAKEVCSSLGIRHHTLDFRELFRERVVDEFARSYENGETPNPCVSCNRHIKFAAFLKEAETLGFDHIATGHYANIEHDTDKGRYRLRRGDFEGKDQSYVLYNMTQPLLEHTLMPLGSYDKPAVRALAREYGLIVGGKADSQDICFVPDGDYAGFLERYTGKKAPAGNFIDTMGNIIGRHRGIWHYTTGQRKGLGVSFGRPMFVLSLDSAENTVMLCEGEELFTRELTVRDVNWLDIQRPDGALRLDVKIRYSHKPAEAVVTPVGDKEARIVF